MTFYLFRTIRTHLLLLVLISVFPALVIMIYSGFRERSHALAMAKADALQVVKNFSYDHERAVGSTRQFLMTLAKVSDIRNMNVVASNELLSQLLKQNLMYSSLFVVTAEGFVHATGSPPLPRTPISVQQRRYFQEVVRVNDFVVGEYAICPAVKWPVLEGKALSSVKSALSNLMFFRLAVVGIMFVAWFMGNARMVNRLGVLVDASHKLAHGNLKIWTGLVYKNDELGGLARSFD